MKSVSLDYWRDYFRTASSDIFGIIDHAILVAASDCPKEFKLRRDRIAERLFSCRLIKCSGCNQVELAVPGHDEDERDDRGCCSKRRDGDNSGSDDDEEEVDIDIDDGGFEYEGGGSKESKVNSSNRDNDFDNGEVNVNDQLVSNFSFGEAEALTDEIEEVSQTVDEVLRIKDILYNSQDESDSVLLESLRKLRLMALTVDTLKATEIGKAVNGLRKHGSEQIRHLARTLIEDWKVLVDEWYSAANVIRGNEGTPDSVNPSVVDEEEGLPSPPLDEGAFFATQPTSMELSQFFDGMDDDGNPRNNGEFIKNHVSRRRPSAENQNISKQKQQTPKGANMPSKDNESQQMRKQEDVVKASKPSNANSGPGRPLKQNVEQKMNQETVLIRKTDKVTSQRKPPTGQQDKLKSSDEVAVQMKLEATKRKLQERYQQAEKAKRQRTIQVMELHDLPKQGHVQKNQPMRLGNHNRHWAHGRR
uniref:TFIIS N-terminal domain-containing protein n=1 Tax=Populus trichocarpa TaxID=3694 RepID=A0A2K1XA26_POPTR|eukprot:XP_002323230.2 probable mediator of RNA polymerase II transcription subunit 26b [Populus trichocarpa]